jgi:hypothetical protein
VTKDDLDLWRSYKTMTQEDLEIAAGNVEKMLKATRDEAMRAYRTSWINSMPEPPGALRGGRRENETPHLPTGMYFGPRKTINFRGFCRIKRGLTTRGYRSWVTGFGVRVSAFERAPTRVKVPAVRFRFARLDLKAAPTGPHRRMPSHLG